MPRFRWFRLVLMRFPRRQLSRRCCLPAISPAALKSLGLDTSKPRVKVPLILFRSFPLSVCLSICRLLLLLLPLPIFTQPIFLVWTFENEMLVCNAVVTQSTRVLNQPPVKVSSKFFQPSYFIVLILASSWSLSLSLSSRIQLFISLLSYLAMLLTLVVGDSILHSSCRLFEKEPAGSIHLFLISFYFWRCVVYASICVQHSRNMLSPLLLRKTGRNFATRVWLNHSVM